MTKQERQEMPPWDSNPPDEIKVKVLKSGMYRAEDSSTADGWWAGVGLHAGEILHEVTSTTEEWRGISDLGFTVFVPFADGEEWE